MTRRPSGALGCPAVWALLLALAAGASPGEAQSYRGWARTTLRYIEVRPLALDSIPRDQVQDLGNGRFEFQGERVQCAGLETCTRYVPRPVDENLLLSQDAAVTFWGLGTPGLSATTMLRGRTRVAGDFVWPRSDDGFEALLAYAQYVRSPFRIRLGRQRTISGLGFAGYDGASVLAGPLEGVTVEAYGGRSLARGLNEPRNEALRGIEDFVLDQEAWLVGAHVEAEPVPGTALSARYQREIWGDRSGLISERGSLNLHTDLLRPLRVDASADYDFGFGRWGKAHLSLGAPLLDDALMVEARLRRYLPYFELSTVWGFFSPVAYTEGEARVSWRPRPDLGLRILGSYRSYHDTDTDILFEPLEDSGWRLGTGADWRRGPWRFDGRYTVELGPGAFLSMGDASVRWVSPDGLTVGLRGSAFQQIEEFRIGEGVVVGAGALAGWEIPGGGARLEGGVDMYRHLWENRTVETDWDQMRAWSSIHVTLGRDPGLRGDRP